MSNIVKNITKNSRLLLVIVLIGVLILLSFKYQMESFQGVDIDSLLKMGPQGPAGPTGDAGPQGVSGQVGPKGPSGQVGPQGPTGPTGLVGLQGLQGPSGSAGETLFNTLKDIEKPENNDNKEDLFDSVFGDDGVTNDDTTLDIVNNLVETIKEKVKEEVNLNPITKYPEYVIIPFNLSQNETNANASYDEYLENDSQGDPKICIGGISAGYDSRSQLPFGWQVCNGAPLQKITKDSSDDYVILNDSGKITPNMRGRFFMGAGSAGENTENMKNETDDDGNDIFYFGEDALYTPRNQATSTDAETFNTDLGGASSIELSMEQMATHSHDNIKDSRSSGSQRGIYGECWGKPRPRIEKNEELQTSSLSDVGEGIKHNNLPPYKPTIFLIKCKEDF